MIFRALNIYLIISIGCFTKVYSQTHIYGKIKKIDSTSVSGYFIIYAYDRRGNENYKIFSKMDTVKNGDRVELGKKLGTRH